MILDILFFVFIVAFAILGFVRGLFKTLTSFFSWVVSLLLAYLLAKSIANELLTANMVQRLVGSKSLYASIYNLLPESLKSISLQEIVTKINSGYSQAEIKEYIRSQSSGIIAFASSLIENAVCKDMYLNSSLTDVGQVLALELTYHIYVVMVGIAIFLVLRIIIMGITLIFNSKFNNRDVRLWERFAGIAMGAIRGFTYACIVLMLFSYISGLSVKINDMVNESKVSVPVTTWVSDTTGEMLSGKLEDNEQYKLMIDTVAKNNSKEQPNEEE